MSIARNLRVLGNDEGKSIPELVEESAEYWEENLNAELKEFHIRELISWYGVGFEHELIKIAMNETFRAPAPSWRYLAAIIRNLNDEKVLTAEAFKKRSAQRRQSQAKSTAGAVGGRVKQVYAQMYGQRTYSEEQLTGASVNQVIEEAKRFEKRSEKNGEKDNRS